MRLNLLVNRCLLTCVAALATVAVSAYDFAADGIYYNITSEKDKTVCVTYFNVDTSNEDYNIYNNAEGACSGDIIVPAEVTNNGTTYKVTVVGEHAFQNCTGLKSIVLSEGIITLGYAAFDGANSLTSVILPNSLSTMGKNAFVECKKLTAINLPEGINEIPGNTFLSCTSLEYLKLPDSITKIGTSAFHGCSKLKSIVIPDGLTEIGAFAFAQCRSLESIHIPDGVSTIQAATFQGCSSLIEIKIPDNVTAIEVNAFINCSNLTKVEIGNGIESIAYTAFQRCPNLKSFTVLAVNPPTAYDHTFDTAHYSTVGLRVPYESIEKYRTAPVWENFFQDRWPLTGIEGVEAEGDNEVVGCYDLYGRTVTEDYRGVVIVRYADGTTSKEVRR